MAQLGYGLELMLQPPSPREYVRQIQESSEDAANTQNQVISEFSLESRVDMLPAWDDACEDDKVYIATIMFEDGQSVNCPASESITLGDSVLVSSGATLELAAPSVTFNPVFMVEPGATLSVNPGAD